MRSFGFVLIVAGLFLAVAPVQAQTAKTSFDLETHATGGAYFFTLQGATDHNPTLTVPANTQITVTIHNTGGADATAHNFCDSYDSKCSEYVSADGDTQTLKFTSGAGSGTYWCLPHKSSGMTGSFQIEGQQATSTPATTKGSPGFELVGLAVALAGVALLLRRK
jgi:plastocyanin